MASDRDASDDIESPLTPQEWERGRFRKLLESGQPLYQVGDENGVLAITPFGSRARFSAGSRHALAALALRGQPYGFSWRDVDDERGAARVCAERAEAVEEDADDERRKLTRRAERHRARADKIAALLPPRAQEGP